MHRLIRFLKFERYYFLYAVILSIPAIFSLLKFGFYGASDDIHIAWLFEMDRAIKTGQIPPRFVPDLSYGFGYPLFNFVFPLPFYVGEFFHLAGLSLVDSVKAVFLISVPLSAISMYFLLRKFTSSILSLAGAVVYIYTPYRSTDLYVRGAIGEILSFVFFPLMILAITNIAERKGFLRWIGVGALSLGGLVLTHNIAAFMFLPFAVLYAVLKLLFNSETRLTDFFRFAVFTILGIMISSYFWLPAISDSQLVKYDTVFNFQDHFPTISQLVTPYFGYGASVPGPYDTMSFFTGTINLILVLLSLVLLGLFWNKYSKDQRIFLVWALITFGISCLMMNYRSTIIWKKIPYLPYFQFPWRFLMMTTFSSSVLIVCLKQVKFNFVAGLLVVILALYLNVSYFRPQDFLGRVDSYFLNRYIPWPTASADYKQTQEEYLRLPTGTQRRPDKNYPRVFETVGIKNVENKNSLDTLITTDSNTPFILDYSKYYFPGWKTFIDGSEVNISAGKPFGQISFSVPQGQHSVLVEFGETNERRFLDLLSLLTLIFAFWLIIKGDIIFLRRK